MEQQILVNKHVSNPAKNVLLSTGSPLLRTQTASFKDLARPFLPVMRLRGTSPGPNLLNRGIQQCQDCLSGLTEDRCVYVRADVRAAGPPSDGTNFLWLCLQNDWRSPGLYRMCIFVCIIRKEVDPKASASVCLCMHACMHVFLLLMSACVCHGWASVQTKAPQRTEARVINLSDRQDPQRLYLAPLLSGKPWHTVSCWDLTSAVWLAHSKAFPSTSCAPDCPGTHGPLCSESPSPIVA